MTDRKVVGRNDRSIQGVLLIAVIVSWFFLYHEALLSAIRIWYISEIFSHGFFIIPGSLYLIWRERGRLKATEVKPNYWVLPLLVVFLVLGVFAKVGGIQVFAHISAFAVLPIAIWVCVGNSIAKIIWFPLLFMLFSIPIGEQLVPYLQKITADLAIGILNWTTIPTFNTGLYIEIPQGKFVVAEACSGIRFFVGSLVFGAVYSHISYQSFTRKSLFMLMALIVPVLANAFRVFGIVVIGYYSDMKYASGADHIIYGWVFFSIVLFVLVLVGELFREKASDPALSEQGGVIHPMKFPLAAVTCTFFMLATMIVWQQSVMTQGDPNAEGLRQSSLSSFGASVSNSRVAFWAPIFEGEGELYRGFASQSGQENIELILGWYPENREGAELVSSFNALYDKESWSKVGETTVQLDTGARGEGVNLMRIVSSSGEFRQILYWYQMSDRMLQSGIKTKLYQSMDVLLGGRGAGALIIWTSPYNKANEDDIRKSLIDVASERYATVLGALPFE